MSAFNNALGVNITAGAKNKGTGYGRLNSPQFFLTSSFMHMAVVAGCTHIFAPAAHGRHENSSRLSHARITRTCSSCHLRSSTSFSNAATLSVDAAAVPFPLFLSSLFSSWSLLSSSLVLTRSVSRSARLLWQCDSCLPLAAISRSFSASSRSRPESLLRHDSSSPPLSDDDLIES